MNQSIFDAQEDGVHVDGQYCFDLWIVPIDIYIGLEQCPHCHSVENHELMEYLEDGITDEYEYLCADLNKCFDCKQIFMVVEAPLLYLDKPVLTRWSVPDTIL